MASSTIPNTLDVVWTNPSPTVPFNSQDISMDLSEYKVLIGLFYEYPDDANRRIISATATKQGDTARVLCPYGSNNPTFSHRTMFFNSSKLNFGDAYNIGGVNNGQCVPVVVYGIK